MKFSYKIALIGPMYSDNEERNLYLASDKKSLDCAMRVYKRSKKAGKVAVLQGFGMGSKAQNVVSRCSTSTSCERSRQRRLLVYASIILFTPEGPLHYFVRLLL